MNIIGFLCKNTFLKKICWYLNLNSRYWPITKWFDWLTKDIRQQNRFNGILHNSCNNAYKNKQLYISSHHQFKAESYSFYCSYMHTMDIHHTGWEQVKCMPVYNSFSFTINLLGYFSVYQKNNEVAIGMSVEMIFEQIEVIYLVKCTKCDVHSDRHCADFLQTCLAKPDKL